MEVEQGVDVVPNGGHARTHAADQVEAPAERVVDRREAGGRALVPGNLLERGAENAHVATGLVARCCQWDASLVSCRTSVNVNVGPVPRWRPRTPPPRAPAGLDEARVTVAVLRSRARGGPREDREAVVFVHGNPGSAADWRDLVRPRRPLRPRGRIRHAGFRAGRQAARLRVLGARRMPASSTRR